MAFVSWSTVGWLAKRQFNEDGKDNWSPGEDSNLRSPSWVGTSLQGQPGHRAGGIPASSDVGHRLRNRKLDLAPAGAEAGKFLRGRARSWILPSRRGAPPSPAGAPPAPPLHALCLFGTGQT